MVEFRLLGSVTLLADGRPVDLGPAKQRTVLAALLVDAGRPVAAETLIDRVWDDTPPSKAREVLYAHIARIRRALATVGGEGRGRGQGEAPEVLRDSGGYVLRTDPNSVDLHRFRALTRQARTASGPEEKQATRLREALDLWHGTALAGLPGSWASRVRDGLEQQRLGAAAQWARAETALGQYAVVIDRLWDLVAHNPCTEALVGELMRALYLDGRAAESLELYARTGAHLTEELGTGPGPELRGIHEGVLCGTLGRPAVTVTPVPASPVAAPTTSRRVPAQLPADVPAFTGRATELASLTRYLTERGTSDGPAPTVVVSAVSGTAGVGKTALAVRWAHQVRDAFPDGQLYVNLRGYDTERPVEPVNALAGFLSALGVAGGEMPLELDDRAARYRTELSGRRLLVVLDNASSEAQVRPLLPGTPGCAVLVTSRDSLAGLVALHGARRLDLELLPLDDALALLRTLVGPRIDAEPEAAAVLTDQCGRLPLALRIAAELAVSRPDSALSELATELADHQRRLEMLDAGGDPQAAVRAVFSWSYERLPETAVRAFRLLGLHPGPDFDTYAAAALTGETSEQARSALEVLTRAHLVQRTRSGRYAMHDLLRAYALWRSDAQDGKAAQRAALTSLYDYCLAASAVAMDTLYPAERHRRPKVAPVEAVLPELNTPEKARTWLDGERHALVLVCGHAAGGSSPDHAVRLAATLYAYLDNGGYVGAALAVHTHALNAAKSVGDTAGEAGALAQLGIVYWQMGEYPVALDHLDRALALFREVGDRVGEARAVGNLGVVSQQMGRHEQAIRHHERALALFRDIGDRVGEANTLANLGAVMTSSGRHDAAVDRLQRGLAVFRELGHEGGEATALTNLGEAYAAQGRPGSSATHYRQALAIFRRIGERYGEVCALNGLAEAEYLAGAPDAAVEYHSAALALASETGERSEQARAHTGLGHAARNLGALTRARDHWRQALTLYTELDAHEANEVWAYLDGLDAAGGNFQAAGGQSQV
ncbi:AfsR/SARP family transcriptional regulator [Streptomyces flaveus]|uniref:AfsR/SARP family transcriptional regulator n=1 Tax=Streptomyces flaveus TaxID=66370 RepID=UPI0033341189